MLTQASPPLPRLILVALLALACLGTGLTPAQAHPVDEAGGAPVVSVPLTPWAQHLEKLIGHHATSVAVGEGGTWLYRHDAATRRAPASNEKLLLSMSLLDRMSPDTRLATSLETDDTDLSDGSVDGNLWIVGSGNPEVTSGTIRALAKRLKNSGVDEVHGRVMGSLRPFNHDWYAPGWHPSFPAIYVALPSALTFNFNQVGGTHIKNPEKRAATAMTHDLRNMNVHVTGTPGAGQAPAGMSIEESVNSKPLEGIMRDMNVPSSNFRAEVLGKVLGVDRSGPPGTIAKGGAAIEAYAHSQGVSVIANDSSGLSYKDRVSPEGMVTLLWFAETQPWEDNLRNSLPGPGQGTLAGRLGGIKVRAKTGTLTGISALSGWVWLDQSNRWAAFSIISRGISKDDAIRIEDGVVRTLNEKAS